MDVSGPNGGDFLEVQGRTFDLAGAEAWTAGTVAGTNLAGQMPAGSLGVVAGTGIAESAAQQWKSLAAISMLGFADMAEGFGLKLPADFTALLGEETAAALGSFEGAPGAQPEITLRTRGGDLKRAKVLATLVTDALGLPAPAAQKLADGFVVGNSKTAVQAAAEHTETLAPPTASPARCRTPTGRPWWSTPTSPRSAPRWNPPRRRRWRHSRPSASPSPPPRARPSGSASRRADARPVS
jgi:hypothetical protein